MKDLWTSLNVIHGLGQEDFSIQFCGHYFHTGGILVPILTVINEKFYGDED